MSLTCSLSRALLAVPSPGDTSGTAAVLRGDLHPSGGGALVSVQFVVALILSHVYALHDGAIQQVTVGARAEGATICVRANAVLAGAGVDQAFVDVFAKVGHRA